MNRRTLESEKLLSSSPSRKSALTGLPVQREFFREEQANAGHMVNDRDLSCINSPTLRLLNALNSEDRGVKVRFSLATIAFDRESAQMSQILSSQGKNAPSDPYPHYLVRLATSRKGMIPVVLKQYGRPALGAQAVFQRIVAHRLQLLVRQGFHGYAMAKRHAASEF